MFSTRWLVIVAGVSGALAVLLGAFAAHGLEAFLAAQQMEAELVAKRVGQFDVGARYHLIHSVGLFALAAFGDGSKRWLAASSLMIAGIVLFSGSLYVLVLTNTPMWGAVTPLGGLSWIASWLLIASLGGRLKQGLPVAPDAG